MCHVRLCRRIATVVRLRVCGQHSPPDYCHGKRTDYNKPLITGLQICLLDGAVRFVDKCRMKKLFYETRVIELSGEKMEPFAAARIIFVRADVVCSYIVEIVC